MMLLMAILLMAILVMTILLMTILLMTILLMSILVVSMMLLVILIMGALRLAPPYPTPRISTPRKRIPELARDDGNTPMVVDWEKRRRAPKTTMRACDPALSNRWVRIEIKEFIKFEQSDTIDTGSIGTSKSEMRAQTTRRPWSSDTRERPHTDGRRPILSMEETCQYKNEPLMAMEWRVVDVQ